MDKALIAESLVILIVASLSLYDGIRLTKAPLLNPDPVGPGWYLVIVAGILFLCTVGYFIKEGAKTKLAARTEGGSLSSFSIGPASWVLMVLIVYTILASLVGYTPATAFFFILAFHLLGVKSWVKSIILAAVFTAAFRFLFYDLAGISLP